MKQIKEKSSAAYHTGGVFDCLYDEHFTLLDAQDSLYELLGYTREEFRDKHQDHLLDSIYTEDQEPVADEIARQLSSGNVFMYENRLITKSGRLQWIWISGELHTAEDGRKYFHCIFHDINDIHQTQEALALSERRYELVLTQTQDIIFELDCETGDIYYSPNFEKKFGYQIPVKGFPDSMFKADIVYKDDVSALREKFQGLVNGDDSMQLEYRLKTSIGSYLWVIVHATALRDNEGRLLKILGIISDINDRKTAMLEAQKNAVSDPLTGLLNRRECIRRISQYIDEGENLAAMLLIDIDNFKSINDTMGHLFGDTVLTEISGNLRTIFRRGDIIARVGGDEFVVFMPHIREKANVTGKLAQIQDIFHRYHALDQSMSISCSIGACFYPENGSDYITLFGKADAAMYHAKKHGKDNYCFYKEGDLPSGLLIPPTAQCGDSGLPHGGCEDTGMVSMDAELLYQQDLQTRLSANEGLILNFRCNLDQDHVDYINGPDCELYNSDMSYDDLLRLNSLRTANPEDRVRFFRMMNRDALVNAFKQGITTLSCDYRRADKDGRLCWVSASTRLIRSVRDGCLYAYGSLTDIDDQKNIELTLKNRVERDPLTGAYNKETAIQIMEEAIAKEQKRGNSYAMAVFNVDNFARIVHESGYRAADHILKELGSQLITRFAGDKITGHLYGDEFVVFLYDNPKPELVIQYAEEVRTAINMPYMFPQSAIPVSISSGIAFDNQNSTDFSDLYQMAWTALSSAKAAGGNFCQVYTDKMKDCADRDEQANPEAGQMPSLPGKASENVLLKCLLSLTSSANFRRAMENTLKVIANHYGADRVYVLELEKSPAGLRDIYEWQKDGIASIRTTKSPLFYPQSMTEPARERLKRLQYVENIIIFEKEEPELYTWLKGAGISSFFLASLEESQDTIGYIGIDNPRKNTSNTSVINGLHYFLSNELIKRRLQNRQEFLSYHDDLTGMLNRNSYKDYCASLSEEGLISLGIISLDINGLKEINRLQGNSCGDNMICQIARILEEEFPGFRIYRFTGDEFLVICENISADSFRTRVRKAQTRLNEVCSISIGSSWSDTDININTLLHSADERRLIDKQTYYDEKQYSGRENSEALKSLLKALSQKRFLVYLQPKINSKDNSLHGAEALVRYHHPSTGIVPPAKFIPYLENSGLIHHIDFFVFEEVCKTLAQWNQQNIPLIPVSLNFSRATLLEDNLISRMEKLAEKYGVDKSFIEVEITESLGEVERDAITFIGSQILLAGYRLSLDDFGAKYSNISFLSALHFDHLKLDKSLVNNLISNENARIIVENIFHLCKELDIQVVAEGVESVEQLEILKKLECWYIQGYYYNKPMPIGDFEKIYLN